MAASAGPTARRAASSSSTTPMTDDDDVGGVGRPGRSEISL